MKIAMVQMAAAPESCHLNEQKILHYIGVACKAGAEIICFPEMVMTGYGFEHKERRLAYQNDLLGKLLELTTEKAIAIIIGGMEQEADRYYISQFIIDEQIQTYRKIHVGQKESEHFSFGSEIMTFDVKGLNVGIMLCYDGHFPELVTIMAEQGADLIFNPSASPNRPASRLKMWQKYLPARAYDNRVWVAAANLRFKGQGGGMMVADADGKVIAYSEAAEDDLLVFEYEKKAYSKTSMHRRDFKVDRRPEVYRKYLR